MNKECISTDSPGTQEGRLALKQTRKLPLLVGQMCRSRAVACPCLKSALLRSIHFSGTCRNNRFPGYHLKGTCAHFQIGKVTVRQRTTLTRCNTNDSSLDVRSYSLMLPVKAVYSFHSLATSAGFTGFQKADSTSPISTHTVFSWE